MTGFVHQEFTDVALRRKNKLIRAEMETFRAEAYRANERSRDWLIGRAVQNLETSIAATGRPARGRTGRLRDAITDPDSHAIGYDGFDFMIHERVRAKAIYWRAIEQGLSAGFVGTRVPLLFQAGNGRFVAASAARGEARADTVTRGIRTARQGGRGRREGQEYGDPRNGGGGWVTIRNPIIAHHYARDAVSAFQRGGIYSRYLNTAIKRHEKALGVRLTTKV